MTAFAKSWRRECLLGRVHSPRSDLHVSRFARVLGNTSRQPLGPGILFNEHIEEPGDIVSEGRARSERRHHSRACRQRVPQAPVLAASLEPNAAL
jgi:hypothetical protein